MRLCLPLVLLFVVACGQNDAISRDSDAWVAERDTLGDTIIVRTVSGSTWGKPARLVPRITIGVAEGDENLMLGNMRAVAVAPDGSIYVSEDTPILKKFGPDGTFIKVFGRLGSGPGEYRNPDGGLAVLKDGRVVIRDPGNGRLNLFTADGQPAGSWRIRSSFNTSRRLYADTAGNLYTLILFDPEARVDDWVMGLQQFSPDGTLGDSIRAPAWEYEPAEIKAEKEGSSSVNNVPFTVSDSWAWSPLGYYIGGVTSAYRIEVFRPGSPLRIERNAPPVPVQPEEAADHRRVVNDNMVMNYPGWVWNGPDVPRIKPPFREVYAGDDGRIWVLLSRPGVKDSTGERRSGTGSGRYSVPIWSEPVAFDLFEPDGRYLGEVMAPDGFQTWPEPIFRGDTVWAAVEDADGVRYIHRMEIEREIAPSRETP
jgi:hypothetical protein